MIELQRDGGKSSSEEKSEQAASENQTKSQSTPTKWTEEEDIKLFQMYKVKGTKWAEIAKSFKGKTKDNIRNRFYSTLRRIARKKSKENRTDGSSAVKGCLLDYVDEAIEYGHYCFSKRGRPKKDSSKPGSSSREEMEERKAPTGRERPPTNSGLSGSASAPFFARHDENYVGQLSCPIVPRSFELNQAMAELINAQQIFINKVITWGLRQTKQ
eukprot:TRINITY_DN3373_c0_g1_i1.p1 TRINITY_DN3373_c0_g1~~TRINITY_DN3373_c0_g1_i1.p1  ORF type:complete len:214 (+),score=53.54 TRINITY_DN3373_c0_g1_i1:603-1244(+)